MNWWRSIGVYLIAAYVVLFCLPPVDVRGTVRPQAGEFSSQLIFEDNLPGDLNHDGRVTTLDAVLLTRYLYAGELLPTTGTAADLDCDGRITPGDVARLIGYIYRGQEIDPC
jgi:predicted secreted protein